MEAVVCTVQPVNIDMGMDRDAFGAGRLLAGADASIAQRANMSGSPKPPCMALLAFRVRGVFCIRQGRFTRSPINAIGARHRNRRSQHPRLHGGNAWKTASERAYETSTTKDNPNVGLS